MMKQNKVLNYFSVTLAALLVGAAVLVILRTTRRQPARAMTADQTLKAKAKEDRRFILAENPVGPGRYANLSALVGESAAVLVGTPQTNISKLTADGTNITLDYQVKVEYVYKGTLRESEIITISLPGGMVKFEDGSTAEVRTPGFGKMQDGKTYALFLARNANNAFVPVDGPQGIFEIPTTNVTRAVKSYTLVPNDPMLKYNGMNVKDFFKELRQAVKYNAAK
jgi:hypothetical protein